MENIKLKDMEIKEKTVLKDASLICTVYNEAENITEFLNHICSQTIVPGEVIIVDGGSIDGTSQIISDYLTFHPSQINIRLIVDKSCNLNESPSPIAKGRNRAIKEARGSIIACTDAGCMIDQRWLEKITEPFLSNNTVEVVGGWYLPDTRSFFEECMAIVFLLPPGAVNERSFTPSARSLAFKKKVWEKVGGFPEISYTGEDTAFILSLRKNGFKINYIPDAIVYWRMHTNLKNFSKLLFRYGYGDGYTAIQLISVFKNLLKIAILIILILLTFNVNKSFGFLLLVYLWILPFNKRFNEALKPNRIIRMPVLVFLKLTADITYIIGYVVGKIKSFDNLKNKA